MRRRSLGVWNGVLDFLLPHLQIAVSCLLTNYIILFYRIEVPDCVPRDRYFRYIMVFVSGGALIMASFALLLLWPQTIGERKLSK